MAFTDEEPWVEFTVSDNNREHYMVSEEDGVSVVLSLVIKEGAEINKTASMYMPPLVAKEVARRLIEQADRVIGLQERGVV